MVTNDATPLDVTNDIQSVVISETAEEHVTTLISNTKLGILPSTGGSGIYFYLTLGGAIAAGSAYFIHKTKKQEELLAQ